MKALITGIAGFAGSHLAELLLSDGVEVFGIKRVRSRTENIDHIIDQIKLFDCDLMDTISIRRVLREVKPDYIFHLAAQAFVRSSWDDPIYTMRCNVEGQMNLFNALVDLNMNPVIQIAGSSEEYGAVEPDDIPIKETCPLRPLSPYAVSKVTQDLMGYQYWKSYGLNVIRTRAFNHSGKRRGKIYATSTFANQIAMIEKGKQPPVIKHGNLDAIRDLTDVRDTVRGYYMLVQKGKPGAVYNICSGNDWTMQKVLNYLVSLSNVKVKMEIDLERLRPSDLPVLIGDNSKIVNAIGWSPTISMETMLGDLLEYWRERV